MSKNYSIIYKLQFYTNFLNYKINTCHPSIGMAFKNKVLLTSLNNLPFEEYRRLLTNVNNEDYCTSPPVKPAPGDVILYHNSSKPMD